MDSKVVPNCAVVEVGENVLELVEISCPVGDTVAAMGAVLNLTVV